MAYLWVFIGGGAGSMCRYALSNWLNPNVATDGLAWGTLAANILACLVLGAGLALLLQDRLDYQWRLLLLTGFCGGFSTFSTFALELIQQGQENVGLAALYLLLSLAGGVAAILLGQSLLAA